MKNIILLTLLISTNLYAESIFTTHSVPKKFSSFTGNIPYIQGKDFEKINQQIQQQLLQDEGVPIDFESDKIYQDHDYLSIRVNQEILGGRTYYRSRYFVIDLKNKKLMTLDQVIKNISFQQQIFHDKLVKNSNHVSYPKHQSQKNVIVLICNIYIEIMQKIRIQLI